MGGNVQSVERAMLLLLALADTNEPPTLQQLTLRARCSASSASRILSTMLKHRVVAQDPLTRRYRLGSQLLALASAQRDSFDLPSLVLPYLKQLRDLTNETAVLSAPVGATNVVLARVESDDPLRYVVRVGDGFPVAALGATNRVMLAFMPPSLAQQVMDEAVRLHDSARIAQLNCDLGSIRASGFVRTWGERVPGSGSMAAGLFDDSGDLCGALALVGPGERLTNDAMDRFEGHVRAAAVAISQELGFRGNYPPSTEEASID